MISVSCSGICGYFILSLICLMLLGVRTVTSSMQTALLSVAEAGGADFANDNKLAVVYLQSQKWDGLHWNGPNYVLELQTSLASLAKYMAPRTALKTYVFHRDEPPGSVTRLASEFPACNVTFLEVHATDWMLTGERETDSSKWTVSGFFHDYRIMGKWRLQFPFLFSKLMGHKYMLFIDVDSRIDSLIGENLVEAHKQNNTFLSYRGKEQDKVVGRGLPELARYFIVSRGIVPTQLYEDCIPPSIEGLHSWNGVSGWKSTIMYGNFVIFGLDFWFRSDVQDFLNLVLASEDAVVHRWNEQATAAMIRLLFVQPSQERWLDNFAYSHGGVVKRKNRKKKNFFGLFG